ncbi:hypothetical protein HORIV_62070 [Vreelandella olivaria]|nr:hypothetical protein HORIV_62070 [Halomonas olivaria]
MAQIEAQRIGMLENGKVMAAAMHNAKFELIGGDSDVFEKLTAGLGYGKAVQGVLDKSPALQATLAGLANRALNADAGKASESA